MEQIFLEKGVIDLHPWHAQRIGDFDAEIVGDERRLDVDQVITPFTQPRQQRTHYARSHHAVFGIERNETGGDSQRVVVFGIRRRIRR